MGRSAMALCALAHKDGNEADLAEIASALDRIIFLLSLNWMAEQQRFVVTGATATERSAPSPAKRAASPVGALRMYSSQASDFTSQDD
jgi:hypothetical protein